MNTTRHAMRGFTLVELLVAMFLALIALLAATELYVNTRQTYRVQAMQSRLAEDGRFALSMLRRIIMQANYRAAGAVGLNAFLTPTVGSEQTSFTVAFTGDGTNTVDCNGAGAAAAQLLIAQSGTSLQCTPLNGTAINWISGNGTEVADFNVQYGVDDNAWPVANNQLYRCAGTGGDCVADVYQAIPKNNNQIVAVKLCLVLSSSDTDGSVTRDTGYQNCSGTAIAASTSDHKLYRTFRATVLLRNR